MIRNFNTAITQPELEPINDELATDEDRELDPELLAAEEAGEITGSAQHAGMGHGDHPRESKSRETSERARTVDHREKHRA